MNKARTLATLMITFSVLLTSSISVGSASVSFAPPTQTSQDDSRSFPETGYTVNKPFIGYWLSHGGLAQQGFPISTEKNLRSTDGKEYKTQYFQRSVFEQHPEFAGTENEVLLKLVGVTFKDRHAKEIPPDPEQKVNPVNTKAFKETGHALGGKFREYWEKHGGLAQQGFPITDEFEMTSTDGKKYTSQVMERAVFELHPEHAGTPNEVLLRLLGVEELEAINAPAPTATPTTRPATPTEVIKPPTPPSGETLGPEDSQTTFVDKNGQTHKFTYDNAPKSDGLLTLGLTLATDEDKSDYAELLKRTGRTSDFKFKVVGYDETTGEPPAGWQMAGALATTGGPIVHYIGRFDQNRNLEIKYRDRNTFEQIKNDPRLARIYGTLIGRNTMGAVMSQDQNVSLSISEFSKYLGSDQIALRIAHKMGLRVDGYTGDFPTNPWPTFWSLQK